MKHTGWWAVATMLALGGCGGQSTSDLGNGGTGGGGNVPGTGGGGNAPGAGGSGNAPGTGGSGNAPSTGPAADYVGTWKGYIESYMSPNSSDEITVVIATGAPTGTVTFGGGAPLPPATDPEVGYPAGIQFQSDVQKPFAGFAYTMSDAKVTGTRIQFAMDGGELWGGWCALQTPGVDPATGEVASCVPNWGFENGSNGCFLSDPNGPKVAVDCGKLFLCTMGHACQCTLQGCAAAQGQIVSLDVKFGATEADGSVADLDNSVHNLHLERQ